MLLVHTAMADHTTGGKGPTCRVRRKKYRPNPLSTTHNNSNTSHTAHCSCIPVQQHVAAASSSYYLVSGIYYSTGHLIRNRKAGPGWFSYPRMGAFYTNFSITTLLLHNLLFFRKSQPAFLLARFLIYYRYQVVIVRCPVLYTEAWRTVSTEKIVVINKWRLPYLTWYTRIYYKRYTRYWYFVPGTWYLVLVISFY